MTRFNTAEAHSTGRRRPLWRIALALYTIAAVTTMVVWVTLIPHAPTYSIQFNMKDDPVGSIIILSLAIQFIIEIIIIIWSDWRLKRRRQMENLPLVELVRDGVVIKTLGTVSTSP